MANSWSLPTSKMEFFVMIVNNITKNPILDASGVVSIVPYTEEST